MMWTKHGLRAGVIGALLALLPISAAWSDVRCLDDAVETAFTAHALRSELMVGALSCGRGEDYNQMIVRHRGELAGHSRLLGRTLAGADADADEALDALFTRLANDASRRSVAEGQGACTRWDALFGALRSAEATALQAFAVETARDGRLWQAPDMAALTGLPRCAG